MEQLRVIETPSPHLIERIAVFAQEEADWFTTPLDISMVNGFVILMYTSDDTLIATGTVSFVSAAWLGNVVVAQKYRRKGYATKLVQALEREVRLRRPTINLCLLASLVGQFLYPKLGFVSMGQASVYKLKSSPPPLPSSLHTVFPTDEQHNAAVRFFHQSAGYSRRSELQAIFRESQQCAVLIRDGKVVAAAWARFTCAHGIGSKAGVLLGPVVAESPDYAISVCSAILRMKGSGQLANSSHGVAAVVLQKRGYDAELNVFKSLGFAEEYQMQYMVKSAKTEEATRSITHEFSCPTPRYFALMGFDLG